MEPREAFAFAQAWRNGELRALQTEEELLWLADLLKRIRPRTVVEIGVQRGGTLFMWTQVAARDALLVGIDERPLGKLGQFSAWAVVRRAAARNEQTIKLLMPADSHERSTLDRLQKILNGRWIDFLFIDGDHSYEGVKRDLEMYSPLVRDGGLIGFHDVNPHTQPQTEGAARLWRELIAAGASTEELVLADAGYGIGLLHHLPSG